MSESFAALLEESINKITMKTGELVLGSVVEVGDDYVIVDAGLKSESAIPIAEFKNIDGEITVKEGDVTEVVPNQCIVVRTEGRGQKRISYAHIDYILHNNNDLADYLQAAGKGNNIPND